MVAQKGTYSSQSKDYSPYHTSPYLAGTPLSLLSRQSTTSWPSAGLDSAGCLSPSRCICYSASATSMPMLVLVLKEWSDRGHGVETLRRRLREEGERRDEERGRLERRVHAAEGEAGARGEELARMMLEFETRAACAEAGVDEKVRRWGISRYLRGGGV